MTNAEKQKAYRARIRADPERREEQKRRDHAKYLDQLEKGNRKLRQDMTDKEHRLVRRAWRKRQRASRQAQRRDQEAVEAIITPPHSPRDDVLHEEPQPSRQKTQGLKVRNKRRKENERTVKRLREQLDSARKRADMYRKRYEREKTKTSGPDTPRSKTRKLLRNLHVRPEVRKTLVYHHALVSDVRKAYKSSNEKTKRQLLKLTAGQLIRKTKFLTGHLNNVGATWTPLHANPKYERLRSAKRNSHAVGSELRKAVVAFYTRDDVSRIVAGKRQTITRKKVKMQKRLLNDSLKELYKKFVSEFGNYQISYAAFCRLRPFWVRQPSEKDKETCLCKIHENHAMLLNAGISSGIVDRSGLTKPGDIVCDANSKVCMYGECDRCKGETITYDVVKVVELNSAAEIEYDKWERVKNDDGYSIVAKVRKQLKSESMMNELTTSTNRMKVHIFNMQHQHEAYTKYIRALDDRSCVLHVDFSENYSCGYSREIQSAHFGGSHQQATLHTGMIYYRNTHIPFTTVSNSMKHGPVAIWKHLEPIHDMIKTHDPAIDTIHYFSDGPCTQYRQKQTFYLFSTACPFPNATWNFFESSHGKGAADGVGGAVKRRADDLLRHGTDLPTPLRLFEELKKTETDVELIWVDEADIEQFRKSMKPVLDSLIPVPGTMKLHQIVKDGHGKIRSRLVSKIADHDESCCHQDLVFTFDVPKPPAVHPQPHPEPILERMAHLMGSVHQNDGN